MNEDRMRKVEALLRQAEDSGATEAEAETFMAKAQELMTKWAIDEATLAQAMSSDQQLKDIVTDARFVDGPYLVAKRDLLHQVVNNNNCRMFFSDGYRTKIRMTVVGFKGDVERAWMLFDSLQIQAAAHLPATPPGYNGTRFRNSYWQGYAAQIGRRLREVHQATVKQSAAGTDLVLRDRTALVKNYMDDRFNLRQSSGTRRTTYGEGVAAGKAAANRSSLGQTGVGGGMGALTR
jgi:hypothetical protein